MEKIGDIAKRIVEDLELKLRKKKRNVCLDENGNPDKITRSTDESMIESCRALGRRIGTANFTNFHANIPQEILDAWDGNGAIDEKGNITTYYLVFYRGKVDTNRPVILDREKIEAIISDAVAGKLKPYIKNINKKD
jgi:hypothetical protein